MPPRLTALPLYIFLAAPLGIGCQTAPSVAHVERAQPATFLSADGHRATAQTASNAQGKAKFHLASRRSDSRNAYGSALLTGGGESDRIPLPRTEVIRDLEPEAPGEQPIGAF